MLKSLDAVRLGNLRPEFFEIEETARRVTHDFHLSKSKDIDPTFKTPPLCMDIELSEGRYLLMGCYDGSLFIHDVRTDVGALQCLHTCKAIAQKSSRGTVAVHCATWYPVDTGMFYASSADGVFRVWDTNKMKLVESYRASSGAIYQHDSPLSYSSHNFVAIAGAMPEVKVLDTRAGSMCQELRRGHKDGSRVYSCQWSPRSDHILASGGSDGNIAFWDVRSSKSRLGILKCPDITPASSSQGSSMNGPVNGLKFSSDGLLLVGYGSSDGFIRVWDAVKGKLVSTVSHHRLKSQRRVCVTMALVPKATSELLFYPDGKAIDVVDVFAPHKDDPAVNGRVVNRLKLHYENVTCLTFNPFENELYSAGWDNNVIVWSADKRATTDFYECAKETRQLRNEARTGQRDADETRPTAQPAQNVGLVLGEDAWSDDEDDAASGI